MRDRPCQQKAPLSLFAVQTISRKYSVPAGTQFPPNLAEPSTFKQFPHESTTRRRQRIVGTSSQGRQFHTKAPLASSPRISADLRSDNQGRSTHCGSNNLHVVPPPSPTAAATLSPQNVVVFLGTITSGVSPAHSFIPHSFIRSTEGRVLHQAEAQGEQDEIPRLERLRSSLCPVSSGSVSVRTRCQPFAFRPKT